MSYLPGSLTCDQAERAISRSLDRRLPRAERRRLRSHLRICERCAAFERLQLANRAALRSLESVPLPVSLSGFLIAPGRGRLVSDQWES